MEKPHGLFVVEVKARDKAGQPLALHHKHAIFLANSILAQRRRTPPRRREVRLHGHGLRPRQILENLPRGVHQFLQPLTRSGGDRKHPVSQGFHFRLKPSQVAARFLQVQLVGGHQLRFLGQLGPVQAQLFVDGAEVVHRVPAFQSRHVHHVDKHPGALHMAQEVVAEADACVRSFHEARDVGDHKALPCAKGHDAQVGRQGRERIGSDLGPGGADSGQQGRFARVGHAHKADVGDDPELEDEPPLLPGLTLFGKTGRLPHRRLKLRVAPAAAPAPGDHHPLPGFRQVGQVLARGLVLDGGAWWDLNDQIRTVPAVAVAPLAVAPVFGFVMNPVLEIHERPKALVDFEDDVAAPAAVATVGPTRRHVFLPPEAHRPVAPVSPFDVDAGCIQEHRSITRPWRKNKGRPTKVRPFVLQPSGRGPRPGLLHCAVGGALRCAGCPRPLLRRTQARRTR